ncbi:glutamate-cysteine ligase family protein [Streptomyces sp. NPDC127118]|uniref:glutamate-cysteine ligase family protein n=1 Tax=Streptomyces sp. NPDC127118 TaxID=3345369 RepID=UPI0036303A68
MGVEEEYFLVGPRTREVVPYGDEVAAQAAEELGAIWSPGSWAGTRWRRRLRRAAPSGNCTGSCGACGRDAGYAGWRHTMWQRWPVSGPPPYFSSYDAYEQHLTALTVTALRAVERGDPGPELSAELLRAARDGLRGERTDPCTGRLSPADGLVPSPLHHIGPAPEETGDRETVVALLRRPAARGAARAR